MSESLGDDGKKKLPLESLDKVVGGLGQAPPEQKTRQQLADALAEIDSQAGKAPSQVIEAGSLKGVVLEPKVAANIAALNQIEKDVAGEVAKLPGGLSAWKLDQKIYAMSDPIAQKLGISQPAASSLAYALAYKSVFEDGASSASSYEAKATFFGTNGGRYDVMNAVIGGMAVEAVLSGDLGKFASRATDAFQALLENARVGSIALQSFLGQGSKMFESAFKLVETLPNGKSQITLPLETTQPGVSAGLLNTLVKIVENDAVARMSTRGTPDETMANALTHLRDSTVALFKSGQAATADTVRLVSEAANACERIVQANLAGGYTGRTMTDLFRQLTGDVSKNYVAAMVNNPGSPAVEFSKQVFTTMIDDLKWWGSHTATASQSVFDELGKLARMDSPNAINDLVQFAKGGMGQALSLIENLARSGTKGALPAVEILVRAGTAGAIDCLQRLGQENAAGTGEVIAKLAKDQVAGAMALVEKLVKGNAPGAAGIFESLVKQNVPGVMPLLESLVRQNVQTGWSTIESLARGRNPQALALLETMAREQGGFFPAISALWSAGASGEVEKLAKDGVRGAMGMFADLAKSNPAQGYAAIERLVRANAPGAMDTLSSLVRQQSAGSLDSLERLARGGNVGNAMALVSSIALDRAPGSVALVENLVRAGVAGSAAVMANMVFRNIEPLDKLEGIAKGGSRAAHEALDQLAESRFTGALGAIARVTKFEVDQAHQALLDGLKAPQTIFQTIDRQAAALEQKLGLDRAAALSLVKAETYEILTETPGYKGSLLFQPIASALANDTASIAKGIGVQTMLFGDAEKGITRFSDLMAEKAGPLSESAKGAIVNEGMAALREGRALAEKTRVGRAVGALIADPTNEDNYKRVIAEGVLFWYGSKKVSDFGKVLGALSGFDSFAQNSTIGKVFDVAGVGDEVRQAARACGKMADNMKDAFVDCYTEGFLNPVFDVAKNTGKNCYELGKSIISGNPADIGKAMGNLMEGLANDYIGSIKTYYLKGGGAALSWTRTIVMDFLNDTGATPYAEKFVDINKEAAIRLGNMAAEGSRIAVAELNSLVHSSGKFAEDAAQQLLRVADQATGPVREQALRAIGEIGRLGGPAKDVLYKAAGYFEDGANAVAKEFSSLYRSTTGWAEDAWNASFGKLF